MRFAVILAVIILATAAFAQVVPNAGFEEDKDGVPVSWSWRTGEGGQGQSEWATTPVHTGQHSFRNKRQGATGYTALDSDYVTVTPGQTYRVTAWLYPMKPIRRGVYFMITQHKPGEAGDDLPNIFGRTTEPFVQQTWQQITVKLTVRGGIDRLRIHCIQAQQASDLYWDDFAVTEDAPEPAPRYEPRTPKRCRTWPRHRQPSPDASAPRRRWRCVASARG